jgi:threonine aldolase
VFTCDDFLAAIKPREHPVYPPTTLVEIENTHNRAGGIIFPQEEARKICEAAAAHGIASYLDGARLWNAAIACGRQPAECAAPFDLVFVALSKGLGAPGGSLLAGKVDTIKRCIRYRRMLGGAMRQVGLFAAAGLYALDHNMNRLHDDHANAKLLAARIATSQRISIDLATVQTNILVFRLSPDAPDAPTVIARSRERGLLLLAFGPRAIRAVTHIDVSREQCERAAALILDIVGEKVG